MVSIVIPVFNGSNFLREAIESALAQTYDNFEVIVVNDGSEDNTEEIAKSYGDRIRYFSKRNGGVATALNVGIENMKGDYFSWLSHDDVYLPNKIEKQIASVLRIDTGKLAVSVCNTMQIDKKGRHIRDMIINPRASRSMNCFLAFDTDTGINGCALLIPSRLFQLCGNFNSDLKVTQDYDMWFRMDSEAQFVFITDILVRQRIHDEQGSIKLYSDIVIETCDKLHYDFISKLNIQDILHYCNDDFSHLMASFNKYKSASYYKTASGIFKVLVDIYIHVRDTESAVQLIHKEILGGSIKQAYELLESINSSKSKPRIVVFHRAWVTGGIERVFTTVINQLHKDYCFIIFTCSHDYESEKFQLPDNIRIVTINDYSNIAFKVLLLSILYKADIFIGNTNYDMDFLPVYVYFRGTEIRTIACNHMYFFISRFATWMYELQTKRLEYLKYANVAAWLTNFSANAYSCFAQNAAVMPNPNTYETIEITKKAKSNHVILSVARFDDSFKRIDRLLKVFKIILKLVPDAKLIVVGRYDPELRLPDTDSPSVADLIKELSFRNDEVVFTGEVVNVSEYYSQASLFLLTSSCEGFGLVISEAAQHGVPSIIFDIPGHDDLIIDGFNGYIIPQDDLQSMADRAVNLLTDYEHLQKLGANAVNYSQKFNQSTICKRWDRLLKVLLSTNCQESINKILLDEFIDQPANWMNFAQVLSSEYNNTLNHYYQAYERLQTGKYYRIYAFINKSIIRYTRYILRHLKRLLKKA